MAEDPKAGGAAAVADPEQELQEKKGYLAQAKEELEKLTKKTSGLEAEIKGLETGVSEITRALGTYDTDSKKMKDDLTTQQSALTSKGTVVDPAVKDQKDKIDKAITDLEKKVSAAGKSADDADTAANQATTEYTAAAAEAQKKAQAYSDLKNAPKAYAEKLKTLKSLNDEIGKAIQNNELAGAYYLLSTARALASEINIPSAAEYKKALQPALDESEEAKTTLRNKKLAVEDANKKAADLRKTASNLSATQKTDILKFLKEQIGK